MESVGTSLGGALSPLISFVVRRLKGSPSPVARNRACLGQSWHLTHISSASGWSRWVLDGAGGCGTQDVNPVQEWDLHIGRGVCV